MTTPESRRFSLGALFLEGFLILLPVLIAYLMIGQLFDMLMALTQPILDVMPARFVPGRWAHQFAAAGILVGICFVVGIAARSGASRRFGGWFEQTFLERFPPYRVLKSLSTWLSGKEAPKQLQPALLDVLPQMRMLVAIVEELEDDQITVFVPLAPTPGIGFLQIVHRDKLTKLDAPMPDAVGWILNWGTETEALFRPSARAE